MRYHFESQQIFSDDKKTIKIFINTKKPKSKK